MRLRTATPTISMIRHLKRLRDGLLSDPTRALVAENARLRVKLRNRRKQLRELNRTVELRGLVIANRSSMREQLRRVKDDQIAALRAANDALTGELAQERAKNGAQTVSS